MDMYNNGANQTPTKDHEQDVPMTTPQAERGVEGVEEMDAAFSSMGIKRSFDCDMSRSGRESIEGSPIMHNSRNWHQMRGEEDPRLKRVDLSKTPLTSLKAISGTYIYIAIT